MSNWIQTLEPGDIGWGLFTYVLPELGFILALILLSQILRERKPPANSLAWLIGIIAVPWLAVPLYLLVGKRKLRKFERAQVREHRRPATECDCGDRVLLEHGPHGVFAPTSGNRISLIPNGKHAYEATVEQIRGAKSSIYLATYIFTNDGTGQAIRDELAARARERIEVRVLVDAYGAMFISKWFFKHLTDAGGSVAFHGSVFRLRGKGRTNLRNHRKMLLCDGTRAIIGGMNIAEEYMGPREFEDRWHDLAVTVEGPVVGDLHDVFLADWKFATDDELTPFLDTVPASGENCDAMAQIVASGPDVNGDPLHEALLVAFYAASKRIWVVTPYFIPDTSLMHALRIAVRRGVDVRIVTPRRSNHVMADLARASYLHQLVDEGVKVHLFGPGMLHAKALLVDDDLAVLGSANIDMRSLFLNFEVTLCARSAQLNASVERWMRGLMRSSSENLPERRAGREILDGIGRLLAPLL